MPEADGYYSANEIAVAALRRLNDTSPSSDAVASALTAYKNLHDEMAENGHVDWPYAMCPLRARNGITQIVAARIASEVRGTSPGEAQAMEAAGRRAFFAANANPAAAGPVRASYF